MDVIDWQALADNCAGDEGLVNEVLELFQKESPELLGDVCRAVDAREAVAIKRSAHRLKGALMSLAAQPASAVARELEVAGAEGNLSQVGDLKGQLEAEMGRLSSVLKERLA
jgi:HPt (histidine-containing phosphotransfer) domain-containing protein